MRKIVVVDYHPEWAEAFEREAARIAEVLGGKHGRHPSHRLDERAGAVRQAHHRHNARGARHRAVDGCNAGFVALGYTPMGEFGIPGRRYFHKGGDERTHHVHVFSEENAEAIERHLAVSAYLRAHADEARAYGELKRALAARFPATGTAIATARTDMCGRWKRGRSSGIGRGRDEEGKIWRNWSAVRMKNLRSRPACGCACGRWKRG